MATFVLTVIGDDKSGLVDALAGVVDTHNGNWTTSQMSQLAGKFAGIVMVTIPNPSADAFVAALAPLEQTGLLDITVEQTGAAPPEPSTVLLLDLLGQDQPGIIADLSGALAERNVSIAELRTETRSAPMAGGLLFEAHAVLHVPPEETLESLTACVEEVAETLMLDIELSAESA